MLIWMHHARSRSILATGGMIAQRTRREIRSEELEILQGVRKVCKLSTVELSLADYAKKTVPKTIDLPFTKEPTAYLFYSGDRVGRVRRLRRRRRTIERQPRQAARCT